MNKLERRQQSREFYKSREWRELRYKILIRDRRVCQLCRTNKGIFHVDHIKPISKYPELKLEPDNLQTLCEDCNLGKSNLFEDDFRNGKMPPSRPIKKRKRKKKKKVVLTPEESLNVIQLVVGKN